MPVPRSTWPLKAVTEPSAVILIKVSNAPSPPEGTGRTTDNDPRVSSEFSGALAVAINLAPRRHGLRHASRHARFQHARRTGRDCSAVLPALRSRTGGAFA